VENRSCCNALGETAVSAELLDQKGKKKNYRRGFTD
jgi:hypothetical protein